MVLFRFRTSLDEPFFEETQFLMLHAKSKERMFVMWPQFIMYVYVHSCWN